MLNGFVRLTLISATLLAGCASSPALRDLAGRTASIAETYQEATAEFARNQAEVASRDQTRIANWKAAGAQSAAETRLLQRSWLLGAKKEKSDRFAQVTSLDAEGIVASLAPPPAAAAPAKRTGVDLKEPIRSLKQIAEQPDLLSRAMFLGEYGAAVNAEIERLRNAAEVEASASDEALPPTPPEP